LFLLFGWRGNSVSVTGGQAGMPASQIVVTQSSIDQMKAQFEKTWQRTPTPEEEKAFVEDLIRNEIYYREALAIGLDRDDEVLKRRLRQKMEFIYEDIASITEPKDEELRAFMNKNREKYLVDPQIAFKQVYISSYKRGKSSDDDARQILAELNEGVSPDTVGDVTMLEPEVRLSPLWDIKKQFGDEFGKSLLDLKPGVWAGPIKSGYGLHLVLVKKRLGGRLPELKEVREAVKRDLMVEKQKELKNAAYAKIRERYNVTVEKPKAVDATVTANVLVKTQWKRSCFCRSSVLSSHECQRLCARIAARNAELRQVKRQVR
jgi:parvulin-like peptidyl-prolyl isomerase